MFKKLCFVACLLAVWGCSSQPGADRPAIGPGWALAIHGGAGTIPEDLPEARVAGYRAALEGALRLGAAVLEEGGSSLDAVEQVVRSLEDDPHFNAGKGAVFNHDGRHELDASIMNGGDLSCGAVARVSGIRNPISLARMVMERTRHVLLAGDGAERFAEEQGVVRVDEAYFFTDYRHRQWQKALAGETTAGGGTVGAVALDRNGNLAAGTSTGGLTNKLFGRVGDSPIVGAGTYAKNGVVALSGTGRGEEYIRHNVAAAIAFRVEREGRSVEEAVHELIHEVLRPGDGGIIAVGADGSIVLDFNTSGMYRGATDSTGRFSVEIWR
jgi:beta-aspartyl-peptidase (threonine type)